MIKPVFLNGDCTYPIGDGIKIIAHIVNNRGSFGKGFVTAISKKSKFPEIEYKKWYKNGIYLDQPFALGNIQIIPISHDIAVSNMIAQDGYFSTFNPVPCQYNALEQCLIKLVDYIKTFGVEKKVSIHIPYLMGCGLGHGNWELVLSILITFICENDINLYIYNFNIT